MLASRQQGKKIADPLRVRLAPVIQLINTTPYFN